VDHLEGKDIEKEAKLMEQEEEIVDLKTKMDAKLKSIISTGPSHDEIATDPMGSIYRKEGSSDGSSIKAVVPSSCRELSRMGHILDGLYLVQNPDTNKIVTVFCDFGISGKSLKNTINCDPRIYHTKYYNSCNEKS